MRSSSSAFTEDSPRLKKTFNYRAVKNRVKQVVDASKAWSEDEFSSALHK